MNAELMSMVSAASPPLGWFEIVRLVLAAFVLGQLIAWSYEHTFSGLSYSRVFTGGLVLMTVLAAVFVLAIGRSFYAGLGLLGVLSIVRFRSTFKAPRDLVFLMATVTVGVAVGVGEVRVAVVGALAVVAVVLYLHHAGFGAHKRYDGVLTFTASVDAPAGPMARVLERHCVRTDLLSVGDVGDLGAEHVYQVKLGRDPHRSQLVGALREIGARDVQLMLQEASLEY